MPVHYIDMQHLNAGCFDASDLFTEACEIGSENGWKNLKHWQPYERAESLPIGQEFR